MGSASGVHAITVFCSWDYKVTQRWATRLQHDNIRTQLKVSWGSPWSPTPVSRGIPVGALKWVFEKDFLFSKAPCPPALVGRGLHSASCTPSPHGRPGVSVRTVRSQSLAHGPPARRWLSWASWKALCLSGVPCCGIRSRGAHSFDPAVGPSGSVPWLLVGEGTAAGSTAQEAGAGRHVPGDGASDGEPQAVVPGAGRR